MAAAQAAALFLQDDALLAECVPVPSARVRAPSNSSSVLLNLRLCGLVELGEAVASALGETLAGARVRVLNASLNRLATFDSQQLRAVGHALEALDLSRNLLRTPGSLAALQRLEWLDLSNNRLVSVEGLTGLPALRTLNLSGNAIESLVGLSALPALETLLADANRLSHVAGLAGLPTLRHLSVQGNQLTDVQTLELCQELRSLRLGANSLANLEALRRVVLGLPKLESLGVAGNPLAADPSHRAVLMQSPSLRVLDGVVVKAFVRQQLEAARRAASVDELVAAVSREYRLRVEAERERKESILLALRRQMDLVESTFVGFSRDMEAELRETLELLQGLREARGGAAEDDVIDSPARQAEWRRQLAALEAERVAFEHETRSVRAREAQLQLAARVAAATRDEKLYAISLQRPALWRRLKRMQAAAQEAGAA
jgi:hypothetical protein